MTVSLSPSRLASALGAECRNGATPVRVSPMIGEWFGRHPDCPIRRPDNHQPGPAVLVVRPADHPPPGQATLITELDDDSLGPALRRAIRAELDITLPGTLVLVHDQGVLIRGAAGTGKSETALELLDRGHQLVSDDAVRIQAGAGSELLGMAPGPIRDRLAIRGLGMLEVTRHYREGVADAAPIGLVVDLEPSHHDADPLAGGWHTTALLGERLPALRLRSGRALALLLERAVALLGARSVAPELIAVTGWELRQCDW